MGMVTDDDGNVGYSAISVTVDDQHAQPMTGYLLRLPEEMGGCWLARWPLTPDGDFTSEHLRLSDIGNDAIDFQIRAEVYRKGKLYARARWWAEAYRVALKAEAG